MSSHAQALTDQSSPVDIYAVCSTYQQLSEHRQNASVRALVHAITSYRYTHKELTTAELAFSQHRKRTLDGSIHKRSRQPQLQPQPPPSTPPTPLSTACAICLVAAADMRLLPCRHDVYCGACWTRQLTTAKLTHRRRRIQQPHRAVEALLFLCPVCRAPAMSCESTTAPDHSALVAQIEQLSQQLTERDAAHTAAGSSVYSQQVTATMHSCSLSIHKLMFTQKKRWLCDSAMDLAMHSWNKRQGVDSDTTAPASSTGRGSRPLV